jgi:hypothetical protein
VDVFIHFLSSFSQQRARETGERDGQKKDGGDQSGMRDWLFRLCSFKKEKNKIDKHSR